MEVIARKKGGLLGSYIFSAVIGLILVGLGVVGSVIFFHVADEYDVFDILLVVLSIVGGIIVFAGSLKTVNDIAIMPQIIITYENGKLKCGSSEFLPSDILNVEYTHAFARYGAYKWGKINIILSYTTISYNYVAEVEQVHNRLIQLMRESKQ